MNFKIITDKAKNFKDLESYKDLCRRIKSVLSSEEIKALGSDPDFYIDKAASAVAKLQREEYYNIQILPGNFESLVKGKLYQTSRAFPQGYAEISALKELSNLIGLPLKRISKYTSEDSDGYVEHIGPGQSDENSHFVYFRAYKDEISWYPISEKVLSNKKYLLKSNDWETPKQFVDYCTDPKNNLYYVHNWKLS